MSSLPDSDGLPVVGDLVVVVDESGPTLAGGVAYVVAAAALLSVADVHAELAMLFTSHRKNPFHWSKEGTETRKRMLDIVIGTGTVAIAHCRQVGRSGQTDARREMLKLTSDWAQLEGASHLIIESGDRVTNSRDQSTLLDHHRERGGVPFAYDWRTKQEPLLWVADALAGAVGEWAVGKSTFWYERLQEAGVITVRFI
jgi:hypothetical protein